MVGPIPPELLDPMIPLLSIVELQFCRFFDYNILLSETLNKKLSPSFQMQIARNLNKECLFNNDMGMTPPEPDGW